MVTEKGARIDPGSLPKVRGDRAMLTQLYQNLMANSLKFVGDGTPVIELTSEDREDEWVLGVRDNGIGIDSQSQSRIFEMFNRLHPRSVYDGNGIGLATCKKIIENLNGSIGVESSPDGTVFSVVLQAADPEFEEKPL